MAATVTVAFESGVRLNFGKRDLSKHEKALARLKTRVVRIGMNGTRAGFKFAECMFREYPELRQAADSR